MRKTKQNIVLACSALFLCFTQSTHAQMNEEFPLIGEWSDDCPKIKRNKEIFTRESSGRIKYESIDRNGEMNVYGYVGNVQQGETIKENLYELKPIKVELLLISKSKKESLGNFFLIYVTGTSKDTDQWRDKYYYYIQKYKVNDVTVVDDMIYLPTKVKLPPYRKCRLL